MFVATLKQAHYKFFYDDDELAVVCLQHFVNTQIMVQAEPKLLRTLRRSDAHSDKVTAGSVIQCCIT